MQGTVKTVKTLNSDTYAGQAFSVVSRSSFLPDGIAIASAKVFSDGKQIGKLLPKCFSTDKDIANNICKVLYEKRQELTLDLSNGARLVKRRTGRMLQADIYVEEPGRRITLGEKAESLVDPAKLLLVPETTAMFIGLQDGESVSLWTSPIFRKCVDATAKDLISIESLLRDCSSKFGDPKPF